MVVVVNRHNVSLVSVAYNARINPEVASVFSTAAYRYGHSMVPAKIALSDYDFVKTRDYWVTDVIYLCMTYFSNTYQLISHAQLKP